MTTQPSTSPDFEQLYYAEHRWLVSWLRVRLNGSQDKAQDFAQETFLRVLLRCPATLEAPRSYLATIAHGLLVDFFRRQDLEKAYLEYLSHTPQAISISEEARAILLETLQEVDRLLSGLPLKVRATFLLSQVEGMGYAEIGKELGISVSCVRKYLQKALEHCLDAA